MQDIALKQLISFLTAVETTDAVVRVGSLHIRKDATNDALLDSTVEIYSPRVAKPLDAGGPGSVTFPVRPLRPL